MRPDRLLTILLVLLASGAILLPAPARAGESSCGTTVPPGLVSGVWTAAGSPYCVTGDIFIAGLNIEPGVEVLVDGPYEIAVRTALHAEGTAEAPIRFTSKDPQGSWQGIAIARAPAHSTFDHCVIERSHNSGLRIFGTKVILRHCTLRNNQTQGRGAAIEALSVFSELVLEDCILESNVSKSHGGAIYATMDPATGRLLMDRCIIRGNSSNPALVLPGFRMHFDTQGGAMFLRGDARIRQCLFEGNRCVSRQAIGMSHARGGAVFLTAGDTVFENCVLRDNEAYALFDGESGIAISQGGAIYLNDGTHVQRNCLVTGNLATTEGGEQILTEAGGLYLNSGDSRLENGTIAVNGDEGVLRNGGSVEILNSIVYGNGAPPSGPLDVAYSCVEGTEAYPGEGNIQADPRFVGSGIGCQAFALQAGSPAIDAGHPDAIYQDGCLPPGQGGLRNDMGAFGGPSTCGWPPACGGPGVPAAFRILFSMSDERFAPGEEIVVRPTIEGDDRNRRINLVLWVKGPTGREVSVLRRYELFVPERFRFEREFSLGRVGEGDLADNGFYTINARATEMVTGRTLTLISSSFTISGL